VAVRSDQLHSHQFSRRRVVAALAGRDPARPPSTGAAAALAGVMVAALALAAVGVFGLLRPADDGSWRDGASVVVERESGARFVYRDGVLHPVLNYSSALLILGSSQPRSSLVPRSALAGVARGAPLGIPGAPDLLPAAGELVTGRWTVCSRPAGAGEESVLHVGSSPAAAASDRAHVVADPDGGLHLLWNRHRYAVRDPDVVLAAFAWPRQSATPVAPALLNAVPAGPDLARLAVDGAGRRSAALPGRRIGQVVVVENSAGGRQFAVVTARGLADVTPVQADLLLAGGADGAATAIRMAQAEYATAPRAPSLVPEGESAPPAETPELAPATGAVCASFADGGGPPELAVVAADSVRRAGELPAPAPTPPASAPVDWLHVPPGRGAVVEALAAPGAPNGALSLVTDLGVRFPVPSREVLTMLGYADVRPQRLPAAVVALLPTGRALDPAAAAQPVVPGR
jgi:type VII secretion protein EccB